MEFGECLNGSSPALSDDATHCAFVADATTVTVGRRLRHTIVPIASRVCPDAILCLRWSPDGHYVLARMVRGLVLCLGLSHDHGTNIWNLRIIARLDEGYNNVYEADWLHTTGPAFFTHCSVATSVWALIGTTPKLLSLPPDVALLMVQTPSRQHFVVVGVSEVSMYTATAQRCSTWRHSGARPTAVATDHSGYLIALHCGPRDLLEVWTCTGAKVREVPEVTGIVWCGTYLACSLRDGSVQCLAGSQSLHVVRLIDPIFSPPGNYLKEVEGRYAVSTAGVLPEKLKDVTAQRVAGCKEYLATTILHSDDTVMVSNVAGDGPPTTLRHKGSVQSLSWAPDGNRLVVRCNGASGNTLFLWEPRKASCARIPFHTFSLSEVRWVDHQTLLLIDDIAHTFSFVWLTDY